LEHYQGAEDHKHYLSNGVIVAADNPDDVFREELIEKVYDVKIQILDIGNRRVVIPIQLINHEQSV